MKRIFILLAICIFTQRAFSQDMMPTSEVEYFKFGEWTKEHKTAVVFADVCNVRSSADSKSDVVGKLNIGTVVQILEVSGTKWTQAGITSPWVKIKTASITGYVWGGLLTNASAKTNDGTGVVWGLISAKPMDGYFADVKASVRLFKDGVLLHKHDLTIEGAGRPDEGYIQIYPKPQLSGVENLIVFGTPSEACGVTATRHDFLYVNKKMVFVGSGHSMGDGGMLYSALEYIFPYPQDETNSYDYHYRPNPEHVLRVESGGYYDDDCVWVETKKAKDFIWNGTGLTKSCEY